eukprot:GSMAST32.ASY1.ANO1.615.1 assembled CDS
MKFNQYTLLTIMALLCSLMQVEAMRNYRAALQYAVDNNTLDRVAGVAYPLDANVRSHLLYVMLYPNNPNDAARYSLAPNDLAVRAQEVLNCVTPIHARMVNQRLQLLRGLQQTRIDSVDLRRGIMHFVNPFVNGIPEECFYYPAREVVFFQNFGRGHIMPLPRQYLANLIPREYLANRRVVRSLVGFDGDYLQDASPELRADREIVILAGCNRPSSLRFAHPALLQDDNLMRSIVVERPNALCYASRALQDNYDFVLAVVRRDGSALEYASERLRDNFNIVLAAVSDYDGKSILFNAALEFASARLQDNYDVVLAAVTSNGSDQLEYASERLRSNIDIYLASRKRDADDQ